MIFWELELCLHEGFEVVCQMREILILFEWIRAGTHHFPANHLVVGSLAWFVEGVYSCCPAELAVSVTVTVLYLC